jgi:hypothetical protein
VNGGKAARRCLIADNLTGAHPMTSTPTSML